MCMWSEGAEHERTHMDWCSSLLRTWHTIEYRMEVTITMALYPPATDSPTKATIYSPLPTHGKTNVSLVLHTTETGGTPSFNGGDTAPHYCYYPKTGKWVMWAEYEDGVVGTLRGHRYGGHGNCQAFQVEIIGYSNPEHDPWVGDFTDGNYQDLADFWRWARERYGMDNTVTPTPASGWMYGTSSPYRMPNEVWDDFGGLTCHGAVPSNSHWDVGVLDLARIHDLSQTEEEEVDYELIRAIIKEEVEAALGGKPITMPDGVRTGNQGVVNSVLWAETHGSPIWEQIHKASVTTASRCLSSS